MCNQIQWSTQRTFTFYLRNHCNFLAILFPVLALGGGIGTILGCIRLTYGTVRYPFYDSISSFGEDAPQYYLFGAGFTWIAILLVYTLSIQVCHLDLYCRRSCSLSWFNSITFFVGVLHLPFLISMAWMDGVNNTIHFILAVVGLGILAFYCFLHVILRICILVSYWSELSSLKNCLQIIEIVYFLGTAAVVPVGVVLWVSGAPIVWEWIAVFCLFAYFFPFVLDFSFMSASDGQKSLVLQDHFEIFDEGHSTYPHDDDDVAHLIRK